jgi:hypothetical protein
MSAGPIQPNHKQIRECYRRAQEPAGLGVAEDLALGAAKALVRSLEKAEPKVQFHEYPKIEHIVIVQAAIKELFAFFKGAGR